MHIGSLGVVLTPGGETQALRRLAESARRWGDVVTSDDHPQRPAVGDALSLGGGRHRGNRAAASDQNIS